MVGALVRSVVRINLLSNRKFTNECVSSCLLFKHQSRSYGKQVHKEEASVIKSSSGGSGTLTYGKQLKESGKTGSYLFVILGGVGVTAYMLYFVFSELFSSESPNVIYDKAFKEVTQHPRVQDLLGEPIKAHGETTSRGRRRHVQHGTYTKDNYEHMVIKFYVVGSRRRATVHVDMKKDDSGKYQYHLLAVELKDYPRETILVKDERQ